ncbi:MAG TPA: hypothetical protein VNU44_12095 [Bryobacteraceae bacterium]|nr:hypothetical protein [Bryobacteraceae bacterium]
MKSQYRSHCLAVVVLTTALSSAALADQSGSVTLTSNTYFNLATGEISNTGGDVFWNGTALAAQGQAGLYNLGRFGARVFKSITARRAARAPYRAASIPAGALIVGDIFGVRTNGGHFAKVSVSAVNGTSVSLQYTTFIAASTNIAAHPSAFGPPPFIYQVQNNYSFLFPGVPNYGIAPGSLFAIQGLNLSGNQTPVLQSSAAPGLPTTLNQTSLSVTVNGVTTTPALYYTSLNAVAAVLPSTTPVGTGTITLNFNGNSTQAPIQVVASAVGLNTISGAGSGAGVLTDASFNLLGLTNSAMPGQAVVLWGSGVGADTSNADTTYPQNQNNLTNIPMQVYIGGISANILYRGRSQYPGLDLIDVVIPPNVSLGCYVSVVVETGSVVSNTVTVPVSAKGGPCSDPALGLSGTQLQSLAAFGATPVKSVAVTVSQYTTSSGKVTDQASVISAATLSAEYGSGDYYTSQGSCAVLARGSEFPFQAPLDAGTVQLTAPTGSLNLGAGGGSYLATLPSGSLGGTYTFTASGGKDVGAFKIAISVPSPFSLTNTSALASITRSQGATVTWTGGFSGGDVMVNGVGAGVNFYCNAPSSAGQLTIPSQTLLALPPGGGKLVVMNATAPQTVSASGLDLGLATGVVSIEVPTVFK